MSDRAKTDQASGKWGVAIRDLGLSVTGPPLGPVIREFEAELANAGVRKVRPRFYLSTEWGVCEGSVAIAIPFYLANAELTSLHAERVGHVEGNGPSDLLRYFRHEMGHVVNYAYALFETPEWLATFGAMDQPYLEEFRLEPFSRKYVRHLPGWYAQKHPDEDWSETFAVWMTPGLDWRSDYSEWPDALAKLQYCDRTMASLADKEPRFTADDLEEDVSELTATVEQFYPSNSAGNDDRLPPGLDVALRSVFADYGGASAEGRASAFDLIRRLERDLTADVYRWTGHFPEKTRPLLRSLSHRAEELGLNYPETRETAVVVSLTTLVTALAMNHVHRGVYLP